MNLLLLLLGHHEVSVLPNAIISHQCYCVIVTSVGFLGARVSSSVQWAKGLLEYNSQVLSARIL